MWQSKILLKLNIDVNKHKAAESLKYVLYLLESIGFGKTKGVLNSD